MPQDGFAFGPVVRQKAPPHLIMKGAIPNLRKSDIKQNPIG